jgi:GH25 family lysozyme M1 (1,4-beta-N-acetylmuramidase)
MRSLRQRHPRNILPLAIRAIDAIFSPMSRRALLLLVPAFFLALTQCRTPVEPGTPTPPAAVAPGQMPQIVNVSAYDPKEKQREGRAYTEHDVSALRENGASALIARAGKGGNLDTKCANFLTAADRAGMLPGVYYRLQNHVDAVAQADQFIDRAKALAASRDWTAGFLLLVGDFDAQSRMDDILRFMDRVESRTGVVPVAYLENSAHLKLLLGGADEATKARIRRMPYWIALYSHDKGYDPKYPQFPIPGHPDVLTKQYNLWSDWTIWQYGGVEWTGGRSVPKVYSHGPYQFPTYFGNLDRPVERNVFKGSQADLQAFWQRHGIALR